MHWVTHHINRNSKLYSQAGLVCGYMFALCASLFYKVLWKDAYYHLNEAAFCMYLLYGYLSISHNTPKWSINWRSFALLVLLSAFAGITDEITQSALNVAWSDMFRFIAILIFVYFWRRSKRRKQHGNLE